MELHARIGYEILAGSTSALVRMAATIALTHHERFDGKWYPQGLGEEIPLEGRITPSPMSSTLCSATVHAAPRCRCRRSRP